MIVRYVDHERRGLLCEMPGADEDRGAILQDVIERAMMAVQGRWYQLMGAKTVRDRQDIEVYVKDCGPITSDDWC